MAADQSPVVIEKKDIVDVEDHFTVPDYLTAYSDYDIMENDNIPTQPTITNVNDNVAGENDIILAKQEITTVNHDIDSVDNHIILTKQESILANDDTVIMGNEMILTKQEVTGEVVARDDEQLSTNFNLDEITAAQQLLRTILLTQQYQVLLVLRDALSNKNIKNKLGYLRSLISAVKSGTFTPIKPVAKKKKSKPIPPSRESTDLAYFLEQMKAKNGGVDTLAAYGGSEAAVADPKGFKKRVCNPKKRH